MRIISERFVATPGGGILYDGSQLGKPSATLFERRHWAAQGALEEVGAGRGSIAILKTQDAQWVLRHYRRGGLAAKFSKDRYWWLGEPRVRSFAEWRLLAELHKRGLPVPAPIAAYYVRTQRTYTADLITERLPPSRTLAETIAAAPLPAQRWQLVGRTIARFHAHGVHHADLNAHNILLGHDGAVYLLDFDRGQMRSRGAWEVRVLARLRRSLRKIKSQQPSVEFGDVEWSWLFEAYEKRREDVGR
jgi:3-deoxy-D-manno-octulosonic acid kinase